MKHGVFQRSLFRMLAVSTAVVALVLSAGCFVVAVGAAGAAGAGTVAYVRGELDTGISMSLEQAVSATNRALDQLELIRISEKKDAFSAVIIARTAEDKKVEIHLTKQGEELTTVQIRIGVFGNEERSRAILAKIDTGK